MDIAEYDEFYKWYKANERRFHCSQMTEVQIAYSAYLHGIKQSHIQVVVRGGVFEMASVHGDKDLLKHTDEQLTANTPTEPLVGGGQAQNVREGKVINMQERERQEIYKKILKRGEPSA